MYRSAVGAPLVNKRSLGSEAPVPSLPRESGRAARSVAFLAMQPLRVWLASLPNLPSPGMLRILLTRKIGSKQNFLLHPFSERNQRIEPSGRFCSGSRARGLSRTKLPNYRFSRITSVTGAFSSPSLKWQRGPSSCAPIASSGPRPSQPVLRPWSWLLFSCLTPFALPPSAM